MTDLFFICETGLCGILRFMPIKPRIIVPDCPHHIIQKGAAGADEYIRIARMVYDKDIW